MKQKKNLASERRRRKLFTVLWSLLLGATTIVLIYYELTAVLYILATLGVTALLVVVALSDLSPKDKLLDDGNRINDSAAIGSGITSTFGVQK
jgi:hypothetical protein